MKAVACHLHGYEHTLGLPWWFRGKEFTCNVGDTVQSLGQEDLLAEEMAIHSSILAWDIPQRKEPHRLQSMALQKNQTATVHGVAKEPDTTQQLNNNNNHKNSS